MEEKIYCSHCGKLIEDDDYEEVGGDIVCTDCYENHTTTCDRYGSVIWTDDSYGEQQGKLDFNSLRDMAETVRGNFTFTVFDQDNTLYIIKGSNPLYLIHFEALGLYVYASTESIMKKALGKSPLSKFTYTKMDCIEGEIIRIDNSGTITKEEFEPAQYRSHFATWYDYEDSYYSIHEELLLAYCGCYGVDSSDVEMLLEYGYTCDEIEDMLADHDLLRETLQMVKCEDSDSLYEQIYGCAY